MDRPVIVFGNCQAQLVADVLEADPAMAGIRVLCERFTVRAQERTLRPTDADVRGCRILFEQVNAFGSFPRGHLLPDDCLRIRFPSLGSAALWPLYMRNEFQRTALPGSPVFWYGDRVIAEGVARGVPPDDLLAFYLDPGAAYLPDIRRLAALDEYRARRMDAACDLGMSDVIVSRLRTEPIFSSRDHPSRELMRILIERLAGAAAGREPAFARCDASAAIRAHARIGVFFDRGEVPVHPGVARALQLSWYDEHKGYRQPDGRVLSYEEYFRDLIAYYYANRRARASGDLAERYPFVGERPLTGARIENDQVVGWYPDGFFGARVQMDLIAPRPVSRLRISGYCPAYHSGEVRLTCSVDLNPQETFDLRPGALFEVDFAVAIGTDAPARVTISSSSSFNMHESGEGTDTRDLSVLVSEIQCAV